MNPSRLIWVAIVASTFIYAVLVWLMKLVPADPAATFRSPVVLALYAAALAMLVAGFVVPSLLRAAPSRTRLVVRLALFETICVFGLMAAFLAHDWRAFVGPWILSLIAFAQAFPTAAEG